MAARALVCQAFSGGVLVRGAPSAAALAAAAAAPATRFLLVADRRVCVVAPGAGGGALALLERPALRELGLEPRGERVEAAAAAGAAGDLYYLGAEPASAAAGAAPGRAALAADVSALLRAPGGGALETALAARGLALQDLRGALAAPQDAATLALAGHAVALSQWHAANAFCARCGAPTAPAAGGARRRCAGAPTAHTAYPRTDPVAIALVESPDGSAVLLGRGRASPPGMLTCLSGFVEQGESVEEAAAREVFEEAGVRLAGAPRLAASQPWPLGRSGAHELMVGVTARAASLALNPDFEEMAEMRWVGRAELRAAVEAVADPASPLARAYYAARRGGAAAAGGAAAPQKPSSAPPEIPYPGFFVPPAFAVANQLMRGWLGAAPAPAAPQSSL
jgi:NAD+ diphosphatase